jgi:hypothetical protein
MGGLMTPYDLSLAPAPGLDPGPSRAPSRRRLPNLGNGQRRVRDVCRQDLTVIVTPDLHCRIITGA